MDRGDVDYTFCLHSVLVHAGDFHGGHYVVFINTDVKSPVSRVSLFDNFLFQGLGLVNSKIRIFSVLSCRMSYVS